MRSMAGILRKCHAQAGGAQGCGVDARRIGASSGADAGRQSGGGRGRGCKAAIKGERSSDEQGMRRHLGTRSACWARRRRAGSDDTGIGIGTIRRGRQWQ